MIRQGDALVGLLAVCYTAQAGLEAMGQGAIAEKDKKRARQAPDDDFPDALEKTNRDGGYLVESKASRFQAVSNNPQPPRTFLGMLLAPRILPRLTHTDVCRIAEEYITAHQRDANAQNPERLKKLATVLRKYSVYQQDWNDLMTQGEPNRIQQVCRTILLGPILAPLSCLSQLIS